MIKPIYEDNHLLVVEKPINIPVQADDSKDLDFLTLLKQYIKDKYQKQGNVYLGLVHRLDRPTGGIMVFAKTSKAASRLSKQFTEHKVEKKYYAVVDGNIPSVGEYIDYVIKDHKNNIVSVNRHGKLAKLTYEKKCTIDSLSLVDVKLDTGRSHQIRVQFSYHGYPLIGDQKYNKKAKPSVQLALFSYYLSFEHPVTKEKMTFQLPMPKRYPFNLFY